MENKKLIVISAIVALVILAIVLIVTLITQLYGFFFVLLTLFIIFIILLSIYIKEKPDEFSVYQKEKKRILRTYGSVIVEVETLPNIAGKNIIKVKSIDDLVDAQLELREPIYYKNDNDSCLFLLLHYNEACIYILKQNEDVISPTEQSIRFMKKEEPLSYDSLLDNIENTLVLKLDELKSVRISPIRNNKKIEVVDKTAIEEKIKENKDFNEKTLVDELSKTTIIKNLQKQLNELEEQHNKDKEEKQKEEVKKEIVKKEVVEEPIVIEKTVKEEKITKEKKEPKKKVSHTKRRTAIYKNKTK